MKLGVQFGTVEDRKNFTKSIIGKGAKFTTNRDDQPQWMKDADAGIKDKPWHEPDVLRKSMERIKCQAERDETWRLIL